MAVSFRWKVQVIVAPETVAQLNELISTPSDRARAAVQKCDGDLMVLGAGGKMGFHLCLTLNRARSAE